MAAQPQQVQDDNPNAPINIQQFEGVKNTSTAERIGPQWFITGQNIDIDDSKQVHLRRGRKLVSAGSWHSIFTSSLGLSYGVRNGDLGRIKADYTHVPIIAVGPQRIQYTEIADTLYWSSTHTNGKIDLKSDTNAAWGQLDGGGQWLSPVLQPTDTLGEIAGKLLRNPPTAEFVAYYNGRIYMAKDRVVWATELYQYDYVDATKTYLMFEEDITGLGVVGDGLYVGTTKQTYFLTGTFGQMKRMVANSSPTIKGSMIPAKLDDFPDHPLRANMAILFATTQGLCVGYDSGIYKNLTSDRFWFPDAVDAVVMNRQQDGISQFIGVFNSGGTPASSMRIGDYVDAEIRRFQGA